MYWARNVRIASNTLSFISGQVERRDLAGEPLGRHAQLEERTGLEQPGVRQLVGEHPGVRERVDDVVPVADDERRSLERAPLLAGRRRAAEEQALDDGRARPGVLPHPVDEDVELPRHAAAGHALRRPRQHPRRRRAEGQPEQQRRERDRGGGQRVVEHRHLDHHPAQALRGERRDLERGVGPERGAHHDRLRDVEVVQQRDDVAPELGHRVAPHVRRPVGRAVPEQVERHHPMPAPGQRARQRLVHSLAEQQAVEQHDHPRALAVARVGEPLAAVEEAP
jgi:hypothetical protein